MKVVFNCCTKPAGCHNAGVTLFKGEKPEVEVKSQTKPDNNQAVEAQLQTQPQLKPQLQQDSVEISDKKTEKKCEGDACK